MIQAPVNKRRRDWFVILRALAKHGISMSDIARACDRATTTVQAWGEGSEPKESDARIVLALWAKVAPDEYGRHQAEFDIRVEVMGITWAGDQSRLCVVDLG